MESMAIAGSPVSITDESLAARAKHGDREAFAQLVERYRDIAIAYSYARIGNRDEAEDIAQDAFVRALVSLPRFRVEACWTAWLMRILRNLCHDHLRRRQVRKHDHFEADWPDDSPTPESHALNSEGRGLLIRALYSLDEKFRTPLLMHYTAGRTYKEIALALGVPESTVVGRMSAGIKALRRKLVD